MSIPIRKRRRLQAAAAIVAVPATVVGCLAVATSAGAASHPHDSRNPAAGHPAKTAARPASSARRLTVGRVHYRKGARGSDPAITVHTGGDRTPPMSGAVAGTPGVTFRAAGNTVPGDTGTCTTDDTGTCTIHIDSTTTQTYTVSVESTASNWFTNPVLGVGTAPLAAGNTGTAYDTITTRSLAPGDTENVPVAVDSTTNLQSRGGQMAFSRVEHEPPTECGLRVAMVFDLSYSIMSPVNHLPQYRAAGEAFVDALQGTPSHIALYTYGTNAPANTTNNSNLSLRPVATAAEAQQVKNHIAGFDTNNQQYTNWDGGLAQVANSDDRYDDVIMLTDGDPTRYGRPNAVSPFPAVATSRFLDVENGIFSANAVKARPGYSEPHPTVLAVGINVPSAGSHANLRSISADGDYYTTDFDHLAGVLRNLARSQCDGTISVVKHVVPHDGTIDDATAGGPGWSFTSTVPSETRTTDDTSAVNFATTGETPTTITAHERDGYTFLHGDTRCHVPGSDTPVTYEQHENGFTVTPNPDEPITCDVYNRAPAPRPAISIVKRAWPTEYGVAGEQITYTFDVKNTGQTPLENIQVHDSIFGPIECPHNELAVGDSMECHYIHYTSEEDVEHGSIHNTVRVTGEDPESREEVSDDSEFTVDHVAGPHIELEKVAFPTQYGAVGEVITYTYRVVNTGTVTLHDVTLHDSRLGGITCPHTVLEPGHEMDCTGRHIITAEDIAAGHIHNLAKVSGHDPESGRTVTDTDDATVAHHSGPELQIQKEASPARFTGAGQTIHYTYRVANTGTVTVHNLSVYDSKLGMVTNCDATTLRPGEETTCRATYTTTQADAERGYIPNFAYARGYEPGGEPVTSGQAEAIVTGPQEVPVTG